MSRQATGGVVFNAKRRDPTFAGRVRYKGHRMYFALGTIAEGWTHAKAQAFVERIVQDIDARREIPFLERRLPGEEGKHLFRLDEILAHACAYQRHLDRALRVALNEHPTNPEPIREALDLAKSLNAPLARAIRTN